MLKKNVESTCCFEPDQRIFVLSQAEINSLHSSLEDSLVKVQISVLVKYLHGSGTQEHDVAGKLWHNIL